MESELHPNAFCRPTYHGSVSDKVYPVRSSAESAVFTCAVGSRRGRQAGTGTGVSSSCALPQGRSKNRRSQKSRQATRGAPSSRHSSGSQT
jgi:hypothetical protein